MIWIDHYVEYATPERGEFNEGCRAEVNDQVLGTPWILFRIFGGSLTIVADDNPDAVPGLILDADDYRVRLMLVVPKVGDGCIVDEFPSPSSLLLTEVWGAGVRASEVWGGALRSVPCGFSFLAVRGRCPEECDGEDRADHAESIGSIWTATPSSLP